jgi:hypothetical protein
VKRLVLAVLLLAVPTTSARGLYRYVIVANVDEDKLVLADEYGQTHAVGAKVYCWEHQGFEADELVLSTENLDTCSSATLVNPRTRKTCEVWCW